MIPLAQLYILILASAPAAYTAYLPQGRNSQRVLSFQVDVQYITGDEAFAIETGLATPEIKVPFVRNQSWGNLTPLYPLPSNTFDLADASHDVPKGCSLDAVHVLHRHGARYPTTHGGTNIDSFTKMLREHDFEASGKLVFLNTWTDKLEHASLTALGHEELYELGKTTQARYGYLLKGVKPPVWRTTSQERMIDSASQFAAGFFESQKAYPHRYQQLIETEGDNLKSTLAPHFTCPNQRLDNDCASKLALAWAEDYTEGIIEKFSGSLEGLTLNASHIVAMQQLCAYEESHEEISRRTVAFGSSPFCDLFEEDDWKNFEYYTDIQFWYNYGFGSDTGRAMGIGYVSELISRISQKRIEDFSTSVNKAIVESAVLFPFGQPIYVDATHETVIVSVLTALNLNILRSDGKLSVKEIKKDRKWVMSHIAPFATNLVTQVLTCKDSPSPSSSSSSTHIRMILNDAVIPLEGIEGCPDEDKDKSKHGLCKFQAFVDGVNKLIKNVDYQDVCYN